MPIVLNGTTGITTPSVASGASTFTGALALPAGGLNVGSGQLAVDASGRVTMPYQPAFAAKLGSSRTITSNTVINFDSVVYNTGNHYNGTTGLFTAPVAGKYFLSAQVLRSTGGSTYVLMSVRINGTNATSTYGQVYNDITASLNQLGGSFLVNLNANDTVGFYYQTASGDVNFYSGEAFASGFLVG